MIKPFIILALCWFCASSTSALADMSAKHNNDLLPMSKTCGDTEITLNFDEAFSQTERGALTRWMDKAFKALSTIYGELPRSSFSVRIKRSTGSVPVPWGQVNRTDPVNVLVVVNPEAGFQELIDDWTIYHELGHLLIPYQGWGDIWFSEGLATYYQNIIQARSGLIDESEMWSRITAGFMRGERNKDWNHLTLTEVSDNLHKTRQYMRVHWSGVLYWLRVDLVLRQQGNWTLDEALKELKYCCEDSYLPANEIAERLDVITESEIFSSSFHQFAIKKNMPDYEETLFELGVEPASGSSVTLSDDADIAELRSRFIKSSELLGE